MLAKLTSGSASYRWMAATIGATSAAPYQLATGRAVMPIGGFSGSDPAPTLTQFQDAVHRKEIHWFISGGGPGGTGPASDGPSNGSPSPGFAPPAGFEPPAGGDFLGGGQLPADFEPPEGFSGGFGPGSPGGSSNQSSQAISSWVSKSFKATTVDGVTLYDLTKPTSPTSSR